MLNLHWPDMFPAMWWPVPGPWGSPKSESVSDPTQGMPRWGHLGEFFAKGYPWPKNQHGINDRIFIYNGFSWITMIYIYMYPLYMIYIYTYLSISYIVFLYYFIWDFHIQWIISTGSYHSEIRFPFHKLWDFHEHFNTLDYMGELDYNGFLRISWNMKIQWEI